MSERLAGRVAVVTGGAAGIGAAICHKLAQEGAKVVVADIDGPAAERVAQDLPRGKQHRWHRSYQVDMANESEIETLVTTTVKWGGHLDVWVNNAAVFQFGSATEASSAGPC